MAVDGVDDVTAALDQGDARPGSPSRRSSTSTADGGARPVRRLASHRGRGVDRRGRLGGRHRARRPGQRRALRLQAGGGQSRRRHRPPPPRGGRHGSRPPVATRLSAHRPQRLRRAHQGGGDGDRRPRRRVGHRVHQHDADPCRRSERHRHRTTPVHPRLRPARRRLLGPGFHRSRRPPARPRHHRHRRDVSHRHVRGRRHRLRARRPALQRRWRGRVRGLRARRRRRCVPGRDRPVEARRGDHHRRHDRRQPSRGRRRATAPAGRRTRPAGAAHRRRHRPRSRRRRGHLRLGPAQGQQRGHAGRGGRRGLRPAAPAR